MTTPQTPSQPTQPVASNPLTAAAGQAFQVAQRERARVLQELKSGALPFEDLVALCQLDPALSKLRLQHLTKHCPYKGAVAVRHWLRSRGLDSSTKLAWLGTPAGRAVFEAIQLELFAPPAQRVSDDQPGPPHRYFPYGRRLDPWAPTEPTEL